MSRTTKRKNRAIFLTLMPSAADELARIMEESAIAYHRAYLMFEKCKNDLDKALARTAKVQKSPLGSLPQWLEIPPD